jgi:hypothetical protein
MRLVASVLLLAGAAFAANSADPSPSQIDDIIAKFAAKEADFSRARGNYTYRQTARVMSADEGGNTTGKWEEVSDIVFTPEGRRTDRVVRAPMSTLTAFSLDPGDIQDLRDVQPFVLTTDELAKYYIRYLGREQVDEIGTFVFAVKPKRLDAGKRYFEGEVWVDDKDLQIVKSYGRGVGTKQGGSQYPKFETYREQIDGKYWFPTYTYANSILHFKEGDQRMKMTVRYEDYKQFKSDTVIKYGDVDEPGKTQPPPPAPPKKP